MAAGLEIQKHWDLIPLTIVPHEINPLGMLGEHEKFGNPEPHTSFAWVYYAHMWARMWSIA